jgi:hypothetical protein
MLWWGVIALATVALTTIYWSGWQSAPKTTAMLPALGAVLDETSVSGISSGAYMAGQFQMAHAKIVKGAAIIAGGPYGCSESLFADTMVGPGAAFLNLSKAVNGCMLDNLSAWGVGDPEKLAEKANERAARNAIDPISDVRDDRIYLFTGTSDHTVLPAIVKRAKAFYEDLGVPESNLKFVENIPAGHAFVTTDEGAACDRSIEPYLVDCDYDQAGELLQHIYGDLAPRSSAPAGQFIEFDQSGYAEASRPDGLASSGMVYVPQYCEINKGCRIHIAFHGCDQNRESVGDAFVKESGFSRWADNNRLIVLFPQVETTVSNPQGCWDWWGYTGNDYLTRTAPQISAVYRMIEALHRQPEA